MPALQMAISKKRKEMIELGEMYGLTDKRTINCSQQLDTLLNIDKAGHNTFLMKVHSKSTY